MEAWRREQRFAVEGVYMQQAVWRGTGTLVSTISNSLLSHTFGLLSCCASHSEGSSECKPWMIVMKAFGLGAVVAVPTVQDCCEVEGAWCAQSVCGADKM